jgi:Zn-dependent oligopeptidase
VCTAQVGVVAEGQSKEEALLMATNRFNEITQELSALANNFSNNALDGTAAFKKLVTDKSLLAGLPDNFLAQAAQSVTRFPCPQHTRTHCFT